MSRIISVLFLSSVFVFGLCKENGKTKEYLEAEIRKTKADIVSVNREDERLRREIKTQSAECVFLIKLNIKVSNKDSAKNQAQQKTIEDLYKQLVKIYDEETQLKKVPLEIERIKLGIKVLEEGIKVLQKRRENSIAKSCFDLGDMSNVTVGKPGILSAAKQFDTIVLENELRLVQSELADAERRNDELKIKLDSDMDLCDQKITNFLSIIEGLRNDHSKGRKTIEEINKELDEQKKRVAELTESAEASVAELAKWKKAAKKVMDRNQKFALDVECYDKLLNDVKDLVSPKD